MLQNVFFALCVWYKFLQSNYTSCFIFQLIYFTFFFSKFGFVQEIFEFDKGGGGVKLEVIII